MGDRAGALGRISKVFILAWAMALASCAKSSGGKGSPPNSPPSQPRPREDRPSGGAEAPSPSIAGETPQGKIPQGGKSSGASAAPPVVKPKRPLPASQGRVIRILHIKLGGSGYFQVIRSELSQKIDGLENITIEDLSSDLNDTNPFEISNRSFNLGDLRNSVEAAGPEHTYSEASAKWFARQVETGRTPDVLVISGHHIPALGWHTDDSLIGSKNVEYYRGSMSSLQMFASANKYPAVRQFFSKVKLAFIGGCWALANLEPHGANGEYLEPHQIAVVYHHFMAGKWRTVGGPSMVHSLEHERDRLVTLYDGDFTRLTRDEICYQIKNECPTLSVERVLPDYGLYDGSHSFNGPYLFKTLLPNAALVMGFHSPSPEHRDVGELLSAAISGSRADLAIRGITFEGHPIQSPLRMIFEERRLSEASYKEVIHALRVNWTKSTYLRNRGRASGSISPALADEDANGPFAYYPESKLIPNAPRFAPYDRR